MAIKLFDARALWGGIAFLMTGCALSTICGLYLYSSIIGENLLKSRMLWEVILNLQILSLALIWFAFDDRIQGAQGRWRVRAVVNFLFCVTVNVVPIGFFFYTTDYSWKGELPDESEIIRIFYIIVFGWAIFEIIVQSGFRLVTGRLLMRSGGLPKRSIGHFIGNMWPIMLLIAILVVAEVSDNRWFYAIAPFIGYLKGGWDFFRRAYRPPRQMAIE